MRLRHLLFPPLAAAAALCAAEPIVAPVPLLAPSPPAPSPGEDALARLAAERAQALGFPAVAADLDRELLARAAPAARPELSLTLATALLDDGRPVEAEATLRASPGAEGAPWRLRLALAEAAQRRFDEAGKELPLIRPEGLPDADRAWLLFLRAMLAEAAGDSAQAGELYRQAGAAPGITDLMQARFFLAEEEARLRQGPVSPQAAEATRQNAQRFQGTPFGYDSIRAYAVMLDGLGRPAEALAALNTGLATLPPGERDRADDFRLLIGMIAGAGADPGRRALMELLESGVDPERQRVALQLLANASVTEDQRDSFRAELDRLIGGSAPDPILDDLLLMRASWALNDGDYAQAEVDARAMLERFPGSPLRPYALGVLTASAWGQRRFRTAADYASQARADLPPGEVRAELGVLVAEAWFRAGLLSRNQSDFSSAADAYAAALRESPAPGGVPPGALMFQRVQAMIDAGSAAAAVPVVDALERDPAFDPVDRWEAEWNLARALELDGQTAAAYARVGGLLSSAPAPGEPALPADVRARMAWLQARLSLDAGRPAETLRLVDGLARSLDGIDPALATSILSSGALLRARAHFALGRDDAALAALAGLRRDFPRSDAAVDSYFVEADHDAGQDRVVDAQRLLIQLADTFPASKEAPYALYQAALQGERLGQDDDLRAAYLLLERLVTKYPASEMVFYARLKEGDLLRRLNEFAPAEEVYRALEDQYPSYPDVVYAQLALADCEDAQSAGDPGHGERALNLFEDLCERADAPEEVRVEAGFNLGALWERRGSLDRAAAVWWKEVVTPFLLDPARAGELGARGRYWMARTLIELGDLLEKQGRYGQAADAWRLVRDRGLPYAQVARDRLARLGGPAAQP